jgi:glycosyltransferase involved in cell wall biosynthesis
MAEHLPRAGSAHDRAQQELHVLHVEMGPYLRGGPQQVVHLIHGLHALGHQNSLVCAPASGIAQALADGPCRIHAAPVWGELDWSLARFVVQTARAAQADLIHLHSGRGAGVFGGLAARWGRWPVVFSRRVDNPESRLLAPLKYRLFDRVVAISHCIERMLLGYGVPASRVRCVHSGIDAAKFAGPVESQWLREQFALPANAIVAGMIAQLMARKGHAIMLQAVQQLVANWPQLRVLVFGSGKLETDLRASIAAAGLGEHVKLAGFRTDLPRIVPSLDFIVHPALAEGLGVALVQAAAAGVPIIGTQAGGIPEIVRHEENGLLVPPGNADALAMAMNRLLGDEPLRRQLGKAGRELVAREFTAEQMVAGNLAVYREVLEERAARRAARRNAA